MTKNKDNVIQFPDKMSGKISARDMEEIHEEAADLATFCIDIIQKEIRKDQSTLSTIDFNDIETPEHRDVFVILNLLASMFLRKSGVHHLLHIELDNMYAKLVTLDYAIKNNINLQDLINEVWEDDDWDDE